MLNKSCELFGAEGHVIFSISALCSVWCDFSTCRADEKKAFLNLWSMASSVLIVNWVFLGERSESGAAGATVRNDNTRLNQHLCHPRASSTAGQVFPIFLLFLPASFLLVHWDECLCWQISLHPYVTPEVPGGRMLTNATHTCSQIPLKRACAVSAAFPWISVFPCLELRSDKSYDTWK